jgi:hypothetical protein
LETLFPILESKFVEPLPKHSQQLITLKKNKLATTLLVALAKATLSNKTQNGMKIKQNFKK